ncbi:MAG: phenylacetate--CoA ligase family protein [Chloroflexi bacterium]|nr:phenylacetate--CoA ligase family protein [Chloroflexota bacterium]
MSKLDQLYARAPLWLQNGMVSTYGVYWHWARFGPNFKGYVQDFHARENFSSSEWKAYQEERLKRLLSICAHDVPFYAQRWTDQQKQAALQGDLQKLPLLEKTPLREHPEQFLRRNLRPFPRFKFFTSGTTGTPIATYFTLAENRQCVALREARSANWAGVSFFEPRATFSGRIVQPDPSDESSVYRYNAIEKQVYFSAFHLKPKTAARYVDALRKHKITWLTGYAVSFYLLAKYILDQNLSVPPLKAVITTSEKLTPDMRAVMQAAYRCRIFEEYSTVETALFASECEHGRLHVSPDVSITEILRPDGTPCQPGEVGEVVTTALLRSYQPLIRFRLGDLAAWDPEPCLCGRQMPVLQEVVGRIEDVVTGPDGRQLVRFHGIFANQPNIIEGQVIQETLRDFTVKVVCTQNFTEQDVADIKCRMAQRLGEGVMISVERVESISRSSSGKFQAVISKWHPQ